MGNFGQNPGQTSSGDRLRQFCPYCGTKLDVGARFCKHCGESVETKIDVGSKTQQKNRVEPNPSQRKAVYEGYLHKCPSCGQILESFVSHCPTCGYEIRGTKSATAVREFELKLQDITERQMPAFEEKKSVMKMVFGRDFKNSDDEAIARQNFEDQKNEEKATLIINFSVPNTKEDILEFMILAASNIQNGLYGLLGGKFTGTMQATASARSPVLYQACGVASQLLYGIGDSVIVFFLDKYLIMTKTD